MGSVKDSKVRSRLQGPVRFGMVLLVWGGAAGAPAQPVPVPEPVAAAASAPTVLGRKVDERAVREAARPFRWILDAEASSRRSAGTAAVPAPTVAPVAAPGGSGAVAARAAPSPTLAPVPRSLPPEVAVGIRPAVSEPPQPEATSPPASAARPARTDDAAVAAAAPPAVPAGLAPPGPAIASAPAAETARPAVGAPARDDSRVAAAEPRPQLRVMVEPEVPDSLLRRRPRGGGNHQVTLDVDIGTDGRVRDVRVRETTLAALADPVREAVLAWIYAPLARAVTETVRLQIESR